MHQKHWELKNRQSSVDRSLHKMGESIKEGRLSKTAIGSSLISQLVIDIADLLCVVGNSKARGLGGKYNRLIKDASKFYDKGKAHEDYMRVAYISLCVMTDNLFKDDGKKRKLQYIAHKIGKALEEEKKLHMFRKLYPDFEYYLDYKFDHRIDKKKAKDKEMYACWHRHDLAWDKWGTKACTQVGLRIIKTIVNCIPDYLYIDSVEQNKSRILFLKAHEAFYDFISESATNLVENYAVNIPCIAPPIDWEVLDDGEIVGGYHTLELQRTTPFIKTKEKKQKKYTLQSPPHQYVEAINYLQTQSWCVDEEALAFLKDAVRYNTLPNQIPVLENLPHPENATGKEHQIIRNWNRRNTARVVGLRRIFAMAEECRQKELFYIYTNDFRGRTYCNGGFLNPQGPEYSRGLLKFHTPKPLGRKGVKWLAVHGANCYGVTDRSYSDRYEWVLDNMEGIRAVSREPTSSEGRSLLTGSSKPIQFYTFCREWVAAIDSRLPNTFQSAIPVALDGSNNGFQHLSALLLDRTGAGRVNMVESTVPQDLYLYVATALKHRITTSTDHPLEQTDIDRINRSFVKPIVMNIPYGLTRRGVSLQLQNQMYELNGRVFKEEWKKIIYLTDLIISILDEVMSSASVLNKYLGYVSDNMASHHKEMQWHTPMGFPVMQPYRKYKESLIKTELFGKKPIYYWDEYVGINRSKARSSIVPNLVHSLDSSHMIKTVLKCKEAGIYLSPIHDSFATHACDVHELREFINDSFYEIYKEDPLKQCWDQWSDLCAIPNLPEYGDYDPEEIKTANYFFH